MIPVPLQTGIDWLIKRYLCTLGLTLFCAEISSVKRNTKEFFVRPTTPRSGVVGRAKAGPSARKGGGQDRAEPIGERGKKKL